MARALAFDPTGTWRRLLTDPDGRMIDYSQDTYEPAQALQDHLTARDITCRFPGCTRRARVSDLDHQIPWPEGPTSARNMEALCEHHHRLKHATNWTVSGDPHGTLRWTSPTGHRYESPPPDYG